jgi:hypothetical protein
MRFLAGHRLRLASAGGWPLFPCPAPFPFTLWWQDFVWALAHQDEVDPAFKELAGKLHLPNSHGVEEQVSRSSRSGYGGGGGYRGMDYGQDKGFVVELPDGKLFKLKNINGRVVEMPNGSVVEMVDGQVYCCASSHNQGSLARADAGRGNAIHGHLQGGGDVQWTTVGDG